MLKHRLVTVNRQPPDLEKIVAPGDSAVNVVLWLASPRLNGTGPFHRRCEVSGSVRATTPATARLDSS